MMKWANGNTPFASSGGLSLNVIRKKTIDYAEDPARKGLGSLYRESRTFSAFSKLFFRYGQIT